MKYISTGQAARLCSVTPDAVLKWIKAGKLPARRTIGGHYRIPREHFENLLSELAGEVGVHGDEEGEEGVRVDEEGVRVDEEGVRVDEERFQYCWEYHYQHGQESNECAQCLVFRAQAKRCFEMNSLSREAGYQGTFCKTSCQDCPYFQEQSGAAVKA